MSLNRTSKFRHVYGNGPNHRQVSDRQRSIRRCSRSHIVICGNRAKASVPFDCSQNSIETRATAADMIDKFSDIARKAVIARNDNGMCLVGTRSFQRREMKKIL